MPTHSDAARMDLDADTWHQNDNGNYYIDCPECGSAATISNIVTYGRCNGYLDDRESETELDEAAMSCTANLALELVYTSDPDAEGSDDAVGEGETDDREDSERGDDRSEADASADEVGAGAGSDVDGTVE